MVEILGSAWDLDSIATAVWPGFSIRDQVLILAYLPEGPTGVIGDSNPPPGFQPATGDPRVHILEGPVPDTLAGLQIGRTWGGRQDAAISYPVRSPRSPDLTLKGLIHEAFHAFQHERPGFERWSTAPLSVSRISRVYTWLTALEGRLLSEALTASSRSVSRDLALEAIAVRQHKCNTLKETECARESDLEMVEGSANYVADAVLRRAGKPETSDSLAARLQRTPSPEGLERGWYYLTGEAWFQLIDRMSPDQSWSERAQTGSLEMLLLSAIDGNKDSLKPVADRVLQSHLANQTAREVDSVLSAAKAKADSVVATFDSLTGTRVKITIAGGWCEASTSRSGEWHLIDDASYTLEDGGREVRYGSGETWYRAEGAIRAQRGTITVVVSGLIMARTAAREIPLNRPGLGLAGRLEITAPNLEVHAENATIVTTDEEVRIVLHGDGAGDGCRAVRG